MYLSPFSPFCFNPPSFFALHARTRPRAQAMTFVLEPHDKEIHLRSLEKSVVTTSVDASVEHVRRFLALKVNMVGPVGRAGFPVNASFSAV